MLTPGVYGGMFVSLMILGSGTTYSQDYPSKPIRIITTTVGGGSDLVARIIAAGIASPLGQSIVVENRGSGTLAAEPVSKAPPDGYTLFVGGAALWILPLLQKTPYEVADFAPLTLVSREVLVLAVHPSVPAQSIKELIALAKAKPGQLNSASGATGGPAHLAAELFKSMAGVNIVNVPYKGGGPAIIALIAGEVQMTIFDPSLIMPHVKAGKLKALAVTSAQPSALVPGLPSVASSGLPGYEWIGMSIMMAPAKTPAAIVSRLNQEVVRVLNRPDVKEKLLSAGAEVVANSPEEFAAIIKADTARISKLIKDAGIKVE